MMINDPCPIDAVEKALQLASRLRVREIPLDFDPGDVLWREIVAVVMERFSNHAELRHELDEVLTRAYQECDDDCEFRRAEPAEDPTSGCSERRLAEYRLREAALEAAERACQRWMARKALRRAGVQGA